MSATGPDSRQPEPEQQAAVERAAQATALAPGRPPGRGESDLQQLAGDLGNRGVGRLLARMEAGEGIIEGGVVHPAVEAAIAGARGAGRPLDRKVSQPLEQSMGASLADVRIHTGEQAASLANAVSARAFTVGNDIFFAGGEYRPGTRAGNELIAHEAAHTVQQQGAPPDGPLVVSEPGDAMEREAEAVARDAGG